MSHPNTSTRLVLLGLVVLLAQFHNMILRAMDRPPNILVILSDDQGWGDLSLNGNTNLATLRIDSLASDGAMFQHFFVCPVCSPTRAEFLTGRYHPRSGVYSTSAGGERIDADETTIAQIFKKAGYKTGIFGKWHNGMQPPYHPNARGFDTYYGFSSGHWGNYFNPPLEQNHERVRGEGYIVDDFTNHAIKFIEDHKGSPFLCYLPFNTPHSPMQVPSQYWDRFKEKELELRNRNPSREHLAHTRAALAMCENIDWNVGRLLDHLDKLDLSQDTIVVYFSDNGPNGNRWNGDMKGRKGSTDEGGVRSPMLIRWPGRVEPGSKIVQIAGVIDLFPTLIDLAGIQAAPPAPLDGISLKPLLTGEEDMHEGRLIFSHWNKRVSVRSQRFRMDHQGHLFDMMNDPGQRKNVASTFPDAKRTLEKAVAAWKTDVLANYPGSPRPFTVGQPGFRQTWLPARDAKATGSIERSNRFPNDSYFTHWTSTQDHLEWNVEIMSTGTYEVLLWQSTRKQDLGALLELGFKDANLQVRVTETWDPPEQGQENDRVKRQESYVKDFKPFRMGNIHLQEGKGILKLKALEIPGSRAPECRLLQLIRRSS